MTDTRTGTVRMRVASIRSRKPGGIIFSGYSLDGGHQDNRQPIVVKAFGDESTGIELGDLWEVTGQATTQTLQLAGFTRIEPVIIANHLMLVKPSGSQVIQWLATHPQIGGIGTVKAQRLWDALGDDLYTALNEGDARTLLDVLKNPDIVENMLAVWLRDGDDTTLRWMQEHRIPLELARKVIRVHGADALARMREDPYRLLSFSAAWGLVDRIAREHLGVAEDDPLRLRAAIEQVLYDQMDQGHTIADQDTLKPPVARLLGSSALGAAAFNVALGNKSIVQADGSYQCAGAWIMERSVANFIAERLGRPHQIPLFCSDLDAVLDAFEAEEALASGIAGFALNEAQRKAVKQTFTQTFSVITGGAGVGKTTVLKALYRLLDTTGQPRYQMALSGRAAKRMRELTGERAYTIAGFLGRVSAEEMGDAPVIIIDEASMVDLATMYRLIRKLPDGARMILVGDPYQLPPIGAGLVLHGLTQSQAVSVSELTVVKRQAADSAIPRFAHAVRHGDWWGELPSDPDRDLAVISCDPRQIIETVLALYELDRDQTQILAATRANRFSGFATISQACTWRYTASQGAKPLCLDGQQTGYYEGDLLLYTRNDWSRDLQNGLLGRLLEVFETPRVVQTDDEDAEPIVALGWVDWEGRQVALLEQDIEWLESGYAISIHKSQGSQFSRVIVPITRSRLLDRTLLYTAITRAQRQIVLVGDVGAMERAVIAQPKAHLRRVALPSMLKQHGVQA